MSTQPALDCEARRAELRDGLPVRKRLGAWNTPDHSADIIVRWALDGQIGALLDPSFGGCSFLRAGLRELERLGAGNAGNLVVGVDIDPLATALDAAHLARKGVSSTNLIYQDFLRTTSLPHARFRAVVGNPPYVRHHWHDLSWQESGQTRAAALGAAVSRRASAWAYFVPQATNFVARDGRLALLLPGAVLNAAYAEAVLDHASQLFEDLSLVRIREPMFSVDEESVLLLGAGRHDRSGSATATVRYREVESLTDLTEDPSASAVTTVGFTSGRYKRVALGKAASDLLDQLTARSDVQTLGELAKVRLGVVTGANRFFVRSQASIPSLTGVRGRDVVSRSSWLQTAIWSAEDQRARSDGPSRIMYVDPDAVLSEPLASEVTEAEQLSIHRRNHTSRRTPWYSITDVATPDVFLPYMGADARGLVLNTTDALCTNAIHRVNWRDCADDMTRGAILSSWSTLFALGAEVFGRHYGGGILKLELSEAQRLPIVARGATADELRELAARLRINHRTGRAYADALILEKQMGLDATDRSLLEAALETLRRRRRRA